MHTHPPQKYEQTFTGRLGFEREPSQSFHSKIVAGQPELGQASVQGRFTENRKRCSQSGGSSHKPVPILCEPASNGGVATRLDRHSSGQKLRFGSGSAPVQCQRSVLLLGSADKCAAFAPPLRRCNDQNLKKFAASKYTCPCKPLATRHRCCELLRNPRMPCGLLPNFFKRSER